jgi:DNA anti-recombination protein RmuC
MDEALGELRRVDTKRHLVMSMASKFSAADRERILGESREILQRLADEAADTRQPEISELEILRAPLESHNSRVRREIAERNARWAAQRLEQQMTTAEEIAALEARLAAQLAAQVAEQRAAVVEMISEAFDVFSDEVSGPLERELAALRAQVATLEAQCKKVEDRNLPLDLPNPLSARRGLQ